MTRKRSFLKPVVLLGGLAALFAIGGLFAWHQGASTVDATKTFAVPAGSLCHLDLPDAATENAAGNTNGILFVGNNPANGCAQDDVDDAIGSFHAVCIEGSSNLTSADNANITWVIMNGPGGNATVNPPGGIKFAGPTGEPCARWGSGGTGTQSISAIWDPGVVGVAPVQFFWKNSLPLIKEWNTIDSTKIISATGNVGDTLAGNTLELDWVSRDCSFFPAIDPGGFCARANLNGTTKDISGVLMPNGQNVSAAGASFIDYTMGSHNDAGGAYNGPVDGAQQIYCNGTLTVTESPQGAVTSACSASGSNCGTVRVEDPTTGIAHILQPGQMVTVNSSDKGVAFQVLPNGAGAVLTTIGNGNCQPDSCVTVGIDTREAGLFHSPPLLTASQETITVCFHVGPPTNTQPILAWAGQRIVLEHDWGFTDANGVRSCPFTGTFFVRYVKESGNGALISDLGHGAASGPDFMVVQVSPAGDGNVGPENNCISRVIYESQDQGEQDVVAHVVECASGGGGIDPDTCTVVSGQVAFLAYYMKFEDVKLTQVPGTRSGLNSGAFTATTPPILAVANDGLPTPNDITSATADVSQDVLARVRVRGWVLADNCPARASTVGSNGEFLPANRCIFPDDWRHIAGGDLAEALHPNYDVWGATPTCTNVAGPFSQLDGPLCGDSLAPHAPVGDGQRETYFPDGVVNAGDAPMPPSLVQLLLSGAGFIRPADKGDIYDPVIANNQFYDTHIPPEPWIPPVNADLSGYQWDSWGTGPKSGLYHSWTSLADSGPPIVSGGAATGGYDMIRIYSDNHGEAMAWLNANLAAGTSTLTALADYPDKRKHFAVLSNDVTVAWTGTVSAVSGGTVSTGSVATSSDPLVTSVTVPPGTSGGTVTITESAVSMSPPSGIVFFGEQVLIDTDGIVGTTDSNPLVITFRLDASLIANCSTLSATPCNENTIDIFKDGVAVPNCDIFPGSTVAAPDPCVSNRAVLDGDVEITVLTSSASIWNFGVAAPVPHDAVMSKLDTGSKDIHLGASGTNFRGVKAHCLNKTAGGDTIRCTVQLSGLPAGCTAQSSGHDKMFGTADDGPVLFGGDGPIFLLDNTSSYGYNQDQNFDFKVKVACSPVPRGAIVTFKGCADGGNLGADPCMDTDDTHPADNVLVRFNRLLK